MHELVSYNRKIIKAEDASMSPVAVSGLYGKGVFTTLTILDGKPFLFDKHWARLSNNAQRLGIDLDRLSKEELALALGELLSANKVVKGRCRITLFDSSSSGIWTALTDRKSSVLIQTAELRELPEPFTVNISPFYVSSTSPLNNLKSCNYLEQTVSYEAAFRAGFDEAVRINEKGEVVSGCISNIFWIVNEAIFTPDVATGCLEGTVRECVLESCAVQAVRASIDKVSKADSVFLSSAGIGIAVVSQMEVNGRVVDFSPIRKEFLIANKLFDLYQI